MVLDEFKVKRLGKTIWYISKYFSIGMQGNVGTRSWFLMEEFSNRNVEVLVLTSDSNHLNQNLSLHSKVVFEDIAGVKVIWLRTFKHKIAKSFGRVLGWLHFEWNIFFLNKKKLPCPDTIIVSSLSLLTIINGYLLKRKYKCKLVFEIRDIWPLTIIEEGGFSKNNPLIWALGLLEKFGYKKSDVIVGTMPNLGEHVAKVLGSHRKVHCIPMGVSNQMLEDTSPVDQAYLEKYLDKRFFNIVYSGTIGITNALEVFFRAAAQMLDTNKGIRFIVVGEGALKKYFEDTYGHLENVIFAPAVNKNQVHSVLCKADLVYFSTYKSKVWNYGQSLNKVIDYMLSGRPVLASYSGYPSMINEAGCGYFVPAEDIRALIKKILEIYSMSEQDRLSVGAKGRNWLLANRRYPDLAERYLAIIYPDTRCEM